MDIGKAVHAYRKKHGLTMEEFAMRAGVSKGYISMIEHGGNPRTGRQVHPKMDTCIRIACVLGVSTSELFPDSEVEDLPRKHAEEYFDPVAALLDARDIRVVARKCLKNATPERIKIAREQLKLLIKVIAMTPKRGK